VDIMHYHIGTRNDLTCTWEVAEEYYRQIMRNSRTINFVTILREPREHLLSYYYYFISHRIRHVSMEPRHQNVDAKYLVRRCISYHQPCESFLLVNWPGCTRFRLFILADAKISPDLTTNNSTHLFVFSLLSRNQS